MSWGTHMLFYPSCYLLYRFWWVPRSKRVAEQTHKQLMDEMCKAKPVDPDYFNPFTPIPFHNNPELKYVYADINMKNYVNQNHINVNDYYWKGFHNSFDHGNKKTYMYNWTCVQ